MRPTILYKKLRHGTHGGIDAVGFFEQPSGVLKGHTLKQFLGNYPDEAAALAAHPDAEGFTSVWTEPTVSLSHLPGEDDPVAGGMYPDDID